MCEQRETCDKLTDRQIYTDKANMNTGIDVKVNHQ